MPLRIRLARAGAKKRPFYHIVVADGRAPRDGRFIERLGFYNPLISKTAPPSEIKNKSRMRLSMDEDRIKFWMARGAQPSDPVMRFLEAANLLEAQTRHSPQKSKPKAKAQARIQAAKDDEEAEKAKQDEEAKQVEDQAEEKKAPPAAAEEQTEQTAPEISQPKDDKDNKDNGAETAPDPASDQDQ